MFERFESGPEGPFSLATSARFLEGFAPAAHEGTGQDLLRFAFVADGLADGERVAGVLVRQEDDAGIGEVQGEADVEVAKRQVCRILSLDVDGAGFPAVAGVARHRCLLRRARTGARASRAWRAPSRGLTG